MPARKTYGWIVGRGCGGCLLGYSRQICSGDSNNYGAWARTTYSWIVGGGRGGGLLVFECQILSLVDIKLARLTVVSGDGVVVVCSWHAVRSALEI